MNTPLSNAKHEHFAQLVSNGDKPYVYALIDPRDGQIFYIGKGYKRRLFAHERDVKRGKINNLTKSQLIKQIIESGLSVKYEILGVYETHESAYLAEKELIVRYENLTNMNIGGAGGTYGVRDPIKSRLKTVEIQLENTLSLVSRIMPFHIWVNAKNWTEKEIDLYKFVVESLKANKEYLEKELFKLCQTQTQT